jgi:hypothetical protein
LGGNAAKILRLWGGWASIEFQGQRSQDIDKNLNLFLVN